MKKANRIMKCFTLIAACLLFITLTACFTTPASSTSKHKGKRADRWLLIGDSYSRRPLNNKNKTWPVQLRKKLKLKASKVHIIQRSGYGIARKDKNFYQVIKKLPANRKVRYIVLQSGPRNDRKASKRQIYKATKRLARLIRKKFPKAHVYYASPNWDAHSEKKQELIRERKKWYKKFAKKVGWTYMSSVQNIYVGDDDWSEEDGHHPNLKGVNKLSSKMAKSLKRVVK